MANYKSEMLEFGYDASLHIEHPAMKLDAIGPTLGLAPRKLHAAGDARIAASGKQLQGKYTNHYCSFDLETTDQQDITDFLRTLIAKFETSRDLFVSIADSGGEVCLFIGVGCSRCCAHQFDRELLNDLGKMGFDLRIDFYGSELPQRKLHPDTQHAE